MKTQRTFAEALERAIHRTKAGKILVVANAGLGLSALVGGPVLQGCSSDGNSGDTSNPEDQTPNDTETIGDGKNDWAQEEGKRDTNMVFFKQGGIWKEDKECGGRAGCMSTDVFVKIQVKQVAGANLDKKRVGIVYHEPGRGGQTTAMGDFYSDLGDGLEEWHVRVNLRKWEHPGAFVFTAWYQDGAGNTYFDDNNGEYHVAAWQGIYSIIRNSYGPSPTLNDQGLSGSIQMELLDLDYDKDVRLVWTLDNWKTVKEYGMGSEYVNNWHWKANTYSGMQIWEIILDYKGSFDSFQYAIVYRHGVKNDAAVYEFWDNNGGQNYLVKKNQSSYSRF